MWGLGFRAEGLGLRGTYLGLEVPILAPLSGLSIYYLSIYRHMEP